MCLFCLAGSSRRFDSGCLWAGLSSLRVPPLCSSIVRALHQHKLGTAAWPSLQQVRCFLAEEFRDLYGAFLNHRMLQNQMLGWFTQHLGCQSGQITPTLVTGLRGSRQCRSPMLQGVPAGMHSDSLISVVRLCVLQIFLCTEPGSQFSFSGRTWPQASSMKESEIGNLPLCFNST